MARILLIDDEPDIRATLGEGLRLKEYQVDVAESAEQAIALERQTAHDVAVIDFVLPKMRGLELLQELRRINPFLRSIIMSGQIDHGVIDPREIQKELEEKISADRYLPKPVSVAELTDAIGELTRTAASGQVDWATTAQQAVRSQNVRAKDVKSLDRRLTRNRRKPSK